MLWIGKRGKQEHWYSWWKKLDRVESNAELDENTTPKKGLIYLGSAIGVSVVAVGVGVLGFNLQNGPVPGPFGVDGVGGAVPSSVPSVGSVGASTSVPADGAGSGTPGGAGGGETVNGVPIPEDVAAAGVLNERAYTTAQGEEVLGQMRIEWTTESRKVTTLMEKKYGLTDKVWKVSEVGPSSYFSFGGAEVFRVETIDGILKDNLFELLYTKVQQEWLDTYWEVFPEFVSMSFDTVDVLSGPSEVPLTSLSGYFLANPVHMTITVQGAEEDFVPYLTTMFNSIRGNAGFASSFQVVVVGVNDITSELLEEEVITPENTAWSAVYTVQVNGVVFKGDGS